MRDGDVIYLDHNSTTPIDHRVIDAMDPYLRGVYGNASSQHVLGARAAQAVEQAREQVAALIGARPQEVIFTSGATESDNLALLGTMAASSERRHVVTAATEHKAVLDPVRHLAEQGCNVTIVESDSTGWVSADAVAAVLRPDTALVSVMAANNEIGTLAPLAEIADACRGVGALFHTDAAQLVGKLALDVDEVAVDLLSLSAHKFYGPKGVGAMFVQRGVTLHPIFHGGGHERGLRSGTLNVAGIVGLGAAAAVAMQQQFRDADSARLLRELLLSELRSAFPNVEVNGHPEYRLPGTLNVRLPGIDADSVQLATPTLAISSGSACTSATPEPSHVLRAIGRTWQEAQECLRFGIGRLTTEADIQGAVAALADGATRLTAPEEVYR
jgi:cysteine desulfurase